MTKGQLRQWLSDEGEAARPEWLELVKKADTVRKLAELFRCRHSETGKSLRGFGFKPPSCVRKIEGSMDRTWEAMAAHEDAKEPCGHLDGEYVYATWFVYKADTADCPDF